MLDEIWRELEAAGQPLAHRRVDAIHPLDLYVGLDASLARELVLIADVIPPGIARKYKAFEVVTAPRGDGRQTLAVRLHRTELSRLFSHLCEDLVESSRRGCSREDAVRFVADRIARWERLLSREHEGLLDDEALRGLVGELVFLKETAIPAKGPIEALNAWRGPLGAAHDFQFAAMAVEVKSVGDDMVAEISSAEQLDSSNEPLILSAVRLLGTMEETADSFSVTGLVRSLRELFEPHGPAAATFDDRLSLVGYADAPAYEARRFVVKEMRHFDVDEGFPRLVPVVLAQGITFVRYGVDLRRCNTFRRAAVF